MGKKQSATNGKPRGKRRWPQRLLRWTAVLASWSMLVGFGVLGWLLYDLPGIDRLEASTRRPSVTLLASDGSMLASYGDLYGQAVTVGDLPPYLTQAIVATEDRRFYDHFGVDLRGLARAIYVNISEWRLVQGGSTITQQLAKNVFLTPDRTLRRKGQEMLLALWLEQRFTKDEILSLYMNRVYFGAGTYGVDAASQRFFGKPAAFVTPYEAAMLAGLLRAPSSYNPVTDDAAADQRARLVLQNMVAAEFLTPEEADKIAAEGRTQSNVVDSDRTGQHFADWVMDQVSSYVGFVDRDLVVVTTLDPKLQRLAQAQLVGVLDKDGPERNASQAALVSMTPDGAVRAMVGGRDYSTSQFNRATQSLRQPGSAFKAFVFLAGLEHGTITPETMMVDSPLSVDGWKPDNYQSKYYGPVTVRDAFARSLNSVAVQISEQVGRPRVTEMARRLGITADLTPGPSLALGSSGVSLLELTGAYATLDNSGQGVWPRGIEEIRDRDGAVLYRREGNGPGQVLNPLQVAQMLDMMTAVVQWGTGRGIQLGRPVAGKTGTGQDYRDAWFVGFSAELVTGVWVGNDDNSPMKAVTGGGLPARLWQAYMREALKDEPVRPLPIPANIAMAEPEPSGLDGLITSIFSGGGGGTSTSTNTAPAAQQRSAQQK
jgi:penicillin-binding protein 1A